jgi:LacI family transcriptional regulator
VAAALLDWHHRRRRVQTKKASTPQIAPRILLVLDTWSGWSRGVLRGFAGVAHERGWTVLHYHSTADLDWLAAEWPPAAAVIGPDPRGPWPATLRSAAAVSVNADRSTEGVASVCPDEKEIAERALEHLLAAGLRDLTTFRFDASPFAVARDLHFQRAAARAGARLSPGWWEDGAEPPRTREDPRALAAWLHDLPKPCGIFACCDAWARVVARYARTTDLRVPEDLALIGVDNDALECELTAPPLSSVAVPWHGMGQAAAWLVQSALAGEAIAGKRVAIAPDRVIARRSTDVLAIDDPIVAAAVAWIRDHADRRLTVPMVANAAKTTRQRLERRFRAVLGRTVMHEVRRAHIELARRLLSATALTLPEIAKQSGFTNAALLGVAFRREIGVPPGVYRRRVCGASADGD